MSQELGQFKVLVFRMKFEITPNSLLIQGIKPLSVLISLISCMPFTTPSFPISYETFVRNFIKHNFLNCFSIEDVV